MPYQSAPEIPLDFKPPDPGTKREKRKVKDVLIDRPYGQGPYAPSRYFLG